ncbi:hypothetical protein [Streptomyces tsukubensis]|uniref:Secreted protein n=1 Tax=Streptomyces tsukubensis TaxID=83656 RepID=A0A1V4AEY9_9ACTN|nr:hypothetical protein [Streptomyces tsukubensis]OON82173.1 hypothetical protein B1H18_03775 [Streptomyces tsukubensis]QFR92659.1 hypothetical protein GBW32_05800 [Streptomyces tsukubensis]
MKPLLLIDVDGPLNPFAAPSAPAGFTAHEMRPAGWGFPSPLRVLLDPRHGAELRGLSRWYEPVWATTWEDRANAWIGPRLGLPWLPYVQWPPDALAWAPAGTYWKTPAVVEYAAGRPFAWVDDEIGDPDRAWVRGHHPGAALLSRIDPSVGLVREDFVRLEEWGRARQG